MQSVKVMVSHALKLDADEKHVEAYSKYLQSTQIIIQNLQTDFNGYAVSSESTRLIHLGQRCMERMGEIVNNLHKNENSSIPTSPLDQTPPTHPLVTELRSSTSESPTSPVPPTGYSSASGADSARDKEQEEYDASVPPNPRDIAKKQNEMLLIAHRKRMATVSKGQATNLTLSLQRRMAENMAVAKSKEQTLMRKQQERHRRLLEEAKRGLQSTMGMSKAELERRLLYSNVLQYEKTSKTLLSWRERLKARPENVKVMKSLLDYLLSFEKHPLTQLLMKYQYCAYNKLQPLIEQYTNKASSNNNTKSPNTVGDNRSTSDNRTSYYIPGSSSIKVNNSKNNKDNQQLNASSDLSSSNKDAGSSISSPTPSLQSSSSINSPSLSSSDDTNSLQSQMSVSSDCTTASAFKEDVQSSHDSATAATTGNDDQDAYVLLSPQEDRNLDDPVTIETLEKEALRRHLTNIVEEVHEYLEKLRTMFVVAYEDLDTVQGKDMCYGCIEERFFKPIWPYIIALYRIVYKEEEDSLRTIMSDNSDSVPADYGVSPKLCLSEPVPTTESHPYEHAAAQLVSTVEHRSPLTKLDCIVRTTRQIVTCVEDHYSNMGSSNVPSLGADDLLPILSYVIIKSKRTELLAEVHALEEFLYEGYLMGEEGYCLTTLQTALSYVSTFFENTTNPPTADSDQ